MKDIFGRELNVGDLIIAKRKTRSSFSLYKLDYIFSIYLGEGTGFIKVLGMQGDDICMTCILLNAFLIESPDEKELEVKNVLLGELKEYSKNTLKRNIHSIDLASYLQGKNKGDIFGQELSVGDLIITSTTKSGKCLTLTNMAILVGENTCFSLITRKPYMHMFKACYKVKETNSIVIEYADKLRTSYMEHIKEITDKKHSRAKSNHIQVPGALYNWKNETYLYLGVCDFTWIYVWSNLVTHSHKGEHIYLKLTQVLANSMLSGKFDRTLQSVLSKELYGLNMYERILHTQKTSGKFLEDELVGYIDFDSFFNEFISLSYNVKYASMTKNTLTKEEFIKTFSTPMYRDTQNIYFEIRRTNSD